MICQLTGILAEAEMTSAVIDVHGVGYFLTIPLSTFDKLPRVGNQVTLLTHLAVKEDDIQLYGFATREEKRLFQLLTSSVTGIGPKLALNVLSYISIDNFVAAVTSQDTKALGKISGIGKKMAERMVLELKDKLVGLSSTAPYAPPTRAPETQQASDAIAALETLGFKRDAATRTVQALLEERPGDSPTAEQLIRLALARLNS